MIANNADKPWKITWLDKFYGNGLQVDAVACFMTIVEFNWNKKRNDSEYVQILSLRLSHMCYPISRRAN